MNKIEVSEDVDYSDDVLAEKFSESSQKLEKELQTEDEDYDWDFSHLEQETKNDKPEGVESIINKKTKLITGLRSKFSNGEASLKQIDEIGKYVSKLAITVDSRTKDLTILWKYFSALYELWSWIKNIYGSLIINEMNELFKICEVTLINCNKDKKIEQNVYSRLRFVKNKLYALRQFSNLGFEVQRIHNGKYENAKKKIIS